MPAPKDKGVQISFYIPHRELHRMLKVLDDYGSRSAGVRRLLLLAHLCGGIEELERVVFKQAQQSG